MFTLSNDSRYLLYSQATDMRKSFDGLSGLIRNQLAVDPRSGTVFLFINKSRDKIKLLQWNGSGYTLYYKRLEKGTFELPSYKQKTGSIKLNYVKLVMILDGLSIKNVVTRKR